MTIERRYPLDIQISNCIFERAGWVEIHVDDDGMPGDVNGDGMVDVDDVNAVINIMLSK